MTTPALTLTLTDAGLAAFTAAQLAGAPPLSVAAVGLTDRAFVLAPTLTALPGEFVRLSTVSGAAIGGNVVHLVVRDDDAEQAYGARGLGLYLTDDTLLGFYGQADRLVEKSLQSSLMLALDLTFPSIEVDQIVFGDANWLNPPATEQTMGVARIATMDEVEAGTAVDRIVTPATLARRLGEVISALMAAIAHTVADYIPLAQRGVAGGVAQLDANTFVPAAQLSRASTADVNARADGAKIVTPAALGASNYLCINGSGVTPAGEWRATSDGMLEQWGEIAASVGGEEPVITVNLPVNFVDTNYRVSLTPILNAASSEKDTWVQLIRNTKAANAFQVQYQRPGTTGGSFGLDGFEWRAWRRSN
jgi:hypothetical protein